VSGIKARELLVLVCIGLSNCAQAPTEEVEMAARRVGRALEADGSLHAPDLMDGAQAALLLARNHLSDRRQFRDAVEAAALACLKADEARARALEVKQRIARMTERCLMEIRALMDEARSHGAGKILGEQLAAFASRHAALEALLDRGSIYEAQEGALVLKDDLLRFLQVIEGKQT
jgi:hypothetical protein